MRPKTRRPRGGAWLCLAALVGPNALAAPPRTAEPPTLRLPKPYTLELVALRHVALFHWVDSLSGMSGGKTVPAHQEEYKQRFGRLTVTERDLLERFRQARERDSRRHLDGSYTGLVWLRHVFLASPDLDAALQDAREGMAPEDYAVLAEAVGYFDPRYDTIWRDAEGLRGFLRRVSEDPMRYRLSKLLERMAGAFGVGDGLPPPRVYLVPVPAGYGTHATAVGPDLLIEVRPVDTLRDQASVIAHETAHYFFAHMDPQILERVESRARGSEPVREAWDVLAEALPTALGQGVADSIFREQAWSLERPWYHIERVDAYAKKLFPVVSLVIDRKKERFDEAFFARALAIYGE